MLAQIEESCWTMAQVRTAAPSTGSGQALGCPVERSSAIFVTEA